MIKAFNIWDISEVKVQDQGLVRYINLEPKIVPKTGARYVGKKFHKSKVFIVERLMNKLMVAGHKGKKHYKSSGNTTGKGTTVYSIVEDTLKRIETTTKQNPIQVLVTAIENAAPREEIISIEYGGARYPKAVECAPQRRVDFALRQMAQGTSHKSFNSKKDAVSYLSEEIINAYNLSQKSAAIAKKLELERQSDSSR
ncbi:30S ribosomal protein S7 [Candidatus Woesearchaeota archaeon]|nr:30S ribosomal protein S7 [Candidatus Woesearchaeota archaeon]